MAGRGHNGDNLAHHQMGFPQGRLMPSLFRFLSVVGLLFAVTAGGLYVLAELFEPVPKEVTQTVHGVKIRK